MIRPAPQRLRRAAWDQALPLGAVVLIFTAWETFVRVREIEPIYLPAPSAIAVYLYRMTVDGTFPYHLGVTVLRILGGFVVAAVTGVVAGLLMGMSPLVAKTADPLIAALYPLPKVSLIPLLIIWLGTGEPYKIVISGVTAFFPIVINTYVGVRQTEPGLIKAAQDLGANLRQVQFKIMIPSAVPSIFAGFRLGMGVAIILIVAAEMIGGQSGMGYLLIHAGQVLETEKVFASLIVLAILGVVITKLQESFDRRVAPWASAPEGP
jgi:NitT/TauT family transport system permease protein